MSDQDDEGVTLEQIADVPTQEEERSRALDSLYSEIEKAFRQAKIPKFEHCSSFLRFCLIVDDYKPKIVYRADKEYEGLEAISKNPNAFRLFGIYLDRKLYVLTHSKK